MTFEIGLEEFKLTDVLQFVLQTKKTGVVHVKSDKAAGEIYFADGFVVHALDDSSEGIDALFNMSSMTSGTASFEPSVRAPKKTIAEGAGKLVETVEKRRVEFQTIKMKLPPMTSVWAKTTKEPESAVALRRTDWQVLAMIDGKRNLAGVIAESKLGGFEAMKTIVWLKEQGLIFEPEQAARTMSRLAGYLNLFLASFGKNGLIWYKRWGVNTDDSARITRAISIDAETMEAQVVSDLNARDIDYFIDTFEAIVHTEGPKIYGKLLFRKKFQEFSAKLKEQA
ncbi:MAG: DUF4388 domain-containing protein [candidate division WOR-3 bacterium]|nr:MAG: DUF4388 domain-containing protein [candidate division WOR-3 bacterium]